MPCPVTLETATAYYVERAKLNRISRCIKVLNKQSETGEYESEEGVANLPRVQRRYLLRSMESGIRRSQANHMLFFNAIREEVTPSGGKPDAYFQDLLFQFYTEKAEEAANVSLTDLDLLYVLIGISGIIGKVVRSRCKGSGECGGRSTQSNSQAVVCCCREGTETS